MNTLKNYLVDAIHEMRKVTWPTKQQTINYSLVVIGLSIGMGIFFGILDYLLNLGLAALIS